MCENKIRKSTNPIADLGENISLHPSMKEDYVLTKIDNLLKNVEEVASSKCIGMSVRITLKILETSENG